MNDRIEYKVINIRQEFNKDIIDGISEKDITKVLNQYAKNNWIVKHVYAWDLYLLERGWK